MCKLYHLPTTHHHHLHTLNIFQDIPISLRVKSKVQVLVYHVIHNATHATPWFHLVPRAYHLFIKHRSVYRNTVPRTWQPFPGSRLLQMLFPLSRIFLPQTFAQVGLFSLCTLSSTTLANVDFPACCIIDPLGFMMHFNLFHNSYHSLNSSHLLIYFCTFISSIASYQSMGYLIKVDLC